MASFSFVVGVMGNVVSILVFASPIKTFWQVLQMKSTGNYKVAPYITTLLSTSLWTLYGVLKAGGILVATVNAAGAVFQLIYIALFLIYAPTDKKIQTAKLVGALNVGFVGAVIGMTLALHHSLRLMFLGFLSAALTICMYASPLSVIKTVMVSRSVEYMPFLLSFFLFLNGGIWATYSLLVRDYYIAVPNTIGFVMGSGQLVIYALYKNKNKATVVRTKTTEQMEEEGSLKLVAETKSDHGMQLQSNEKIGDEAEKSSTIMMNMNGAAKVNGNSLRKGKSLPKPTITRQTSVKKIIKTLSVGAYNLPSAWTKVDAC